MIPSDTDTVTVTVVVALTDPLPTDQLRDTLSRFNGEMGSIGEVSVVDASGTSAAREIAESLDRVRVLDQPRGRLAPELWRSGLLLSRASFVAFTTAQMRPTVGWLDALLLRQRATNAVGVGGPIAPGPDLSPTDRAVALLRYSAYFPANPTRRVRSADQWSHPTKQIDSHTHSSTHPKQVAPPGDNALYRRDALLNVEPSWSDGFWEVEVHRALLDRGGSLAMADDAVVTFQGGIGLSSMARQRWRHARRYGEGRASGLGSIARGLKVAASPIVPALLCRRIAGALREREIPIRPWLVALPGLVVLASAWAIGEAVGACKIQTREPMIQRV